MSMEILVLSDERLATMADWQRAIDAEGFALVLSEKATFAALSGFLPARWDKTPTGFECEHDDAREVMAVYASVNFGHEWKYALAFRWASDLRECMAAFMAAVAYARATHGIVFDPQESEILTPQQASEVTRGMAKDLPEIERSLLAVAKKFAPGS
jgi:hypothetical protein